MTAEQKNQIISLRIQGLKFTEISHTLDIPVTTVKSFCYSHQIGKLDAVCKHCGKPIKRKANCKKRLFCSDECRFAWWKIHPEESKRQKLYDHICAYCGVAFSSYHNHNRYCSRKCYADARRKVATDE